MKWSNRKGARRAAGTPVAGGFLIGERVRLSPEGKELFPKVRLDRGVVVGESRDGSCIRVKRGTMRQPQSFRVSFWEHEP